MTEQFSIEEIFKRQGLPPLNRNTNISEEEILDDFFKKLGIPPLKGKSNKKEYNTTISNVISQINSEGNACVEIGKPIDIPNNTEVEIDDNRNILNGQLAYSGSGTDSLTLTTTLDVHKFGFKNVTYTLDLDNIVTRKPNAYNQHVTIKKNSSGYKISMIRGDTDDNASSKTGTVVTPASHGTVSSYTASGDDADTFTYTPHNGFRGEDFFTFTMSDGETASE